MNLEEDEEGEENSLIFMNMHSLIFNKCYDKRGARSKRLEDKISTSYFAFTKWRARLGMRQFLYREVLHRGSLKEDKVLEICKAFARQGCRGCNGSKYGIVEEEKRLHELKCWEVRNLRMCG